jgi:hypothetical protein
MGRPHQLDRVHCRRQRRQGEVLRVLGDRRRRVSLQCHVHGVLDCLPLRPRVRVHQPRYEPDHGLCHPLHHVRRDPAQRLLSMLTLPAHTEDEHRVHVMFLEEVHLVLLVRGQQVEEHRHAAGQDGVERRSPRHRRPRAAGRSAALLNMDVSILSPHNLLYNQIFVVRKTPSS